MKRSENFNNGFQKYSKFEEKQLAVSKKKILKDKPQN